MDDKDLKSLQDIEAPLSTPRARDTAMRAGLQAFEQAGENKSPETQGSFALPRLISNAITNTLEWIMRQRAIIGFAALAAVAIPVTLNILDEDAVPTLTADRKPAKESRKQDNNRTDGTLLDLAGGQETDGDDARTTSQTKYANGRVVGEKKERTIEGFVTLDKTAREAPVLLAPPAPPAASGDAISSIVTAAIEPEAEAPKTLPRVRQAKPALKYKRVATGIYPDQQPRVFIEQNRDQFAAFESNPLKQVARDPVSTFSIDIDTASYTFARKLIQQGRLPQKHAVRVEEMINYFNYAYPGPDNAETPFRSTVGVYPTPWNPDTKLIHIGIKGYDIVPAEKPRANLVFLLDVSGSMNAPDKLPLLKSAFRLLVDKLDENDTVSIVTYAGRAGTVLEPTKVSEKRKILAALERLQSGGSTAGAQGIRQAYALAEENFDKDGVNRVILATDGDFNVGIVDRGQLKDYIAKKRKTGVFLSILGFGAGNYNDALMQTLAQNGNGNASYIDNLNEARKVLVEEAGSTLFPIASDVKIQIEFNPALVSDYRLVGYETRALKNEDFNNDKVDAGDIGSGHTVTAIYEITPVGANNKRIDPLRYGAAEKQQDSVEPAAAGGETNANEYAFLKLRYKLPKEDTSKLVSLPVTRDLEVTDISQASTEIRFAASVAAFGQKLRGSTMLGDYSWDQIADLASSARGNDKFGYRNEFVSLVRLAKSLSR